MKLSELFKTTNIYYEKNWRVINSKQQELLQFFNDINIEKIDHKKITSYIEYMKQKNNKPATINAKLSYLKSILNYAYKNQIISNKVFIPVIKNTATKTLYFTDDEIEQMLNYTEEQQLTELKQVILIGLNIGLRINEILHLKPDSSIYDNYYHSFDNKTQNETAIPLNKTMQELFNGGGFKPFTLNYQQIQYQFKQMIKALGFDESKTIHTLRHTFCSNLLKKNVTLPVIQALANHKSIQTTMRYTHVQNDALEKAVALL